MGGTSKQFFHKYSEFTSSYIGIHFARSILRINSRWLLHLILLFKFIREEMVTKFP